jgi:penicillin-binding protein 2
VDYLLRKRTVRLFWVFVVIFLGLIGHLAYIQIYSGGSLSRQAITQQTQTVSLEVPPRGQILDRELKPLTAYRSEWRVIVFPAAVADRQQASRTLAAALDVPAEEAARYFTGRASMLPYDLSVDQAGKIRNLELPGIIVEKAEIQSRKPVLASHLLGYLGKNEKNQWQGKMGLEAFYDSELRSAVPEAMARVHLDARGSYISGLGIKVDQNMVDESRKNVVLTIDSDIQKITEEVLDQSGVKDGAAVVMDVRSGDILAMASRPDYTVEADVYDEEQSAPVEQSFLNHSMSIYQPGSVFKVVVAAAALEEGIVKPDTLFLCVGAKDELVKCYKEAGHGLITFSEAVAYSCNPTFARVGLKLGADKLVWYAKKFGLANGSIIGYKKSDLSAKLNMITEPNSMVNASLGQWPVQATVVQVTAMMAAIANDGVYIPPRLVSEIRSNDGKTIKNIEPGQEVRAVSKLSADLTQIMLEMVTQFGTGQVAYISEWGSAGKTGSAQVGNQKVDAWFSGYAPVNNPRYVVTVLVNDGESGGATAAPLFKDIMEQILAIEGN